MNLLLPMTLASLVVTGMGVAILGSIKMPLASRLAIDEARVGGLVSVFGFVMSPVIFFSGFLTDAVGQRAVLLGGSLLMAISLAVLARSRDYWTGFVAVIISSAGWAAMVNANNTLIPLSFPGDMARANNLANVFFGAGAFLTPLAVSTLLRRTSFAAALSILAAVAALPIALALGVDFASIASRGPAAASETPQIPAGFGTLLRDPIMWLCGFALFFYAPLEACTSAWATTYLGEKGISEKSASNYLSAFWLAFIAARFVTAFTLPDGHETTLICVMAVASIAVLAGVVTSRGGGFAAAMVIAAGFAYGPIFPTLMGVLLGHFDRAIHGRAVGLLFAIGGVGWTVTPMLIGAYARRTSVQRGFAIAIASAVGLTVVAVALARVQ